MMRNKVCNKCKVDLPIDFFYTYYCSERKKTRVHSKCSKCANKDRVKTAQKKNASGLSPSTLYDRSPKRRFSSAKNLAGRRNLKWELSLEEHKHLLSGGLCHYCEGPLPLTRSGLDRMNNSIGYTLDNCVACCQECNRLKGNKLGNYPLTTSKVNGNNL